MTTKRFILLMTLALTAGMMHAQDPVEIGDFPLAEDTLLASKDTIATDTIESIPDPEWYVAPISYDSVMARHKIMRRAAANICTKPDSVQTFNENSILKYVSIYEYGDTVRTIKWKVYPDGSREGDTKTELSNDGYTFYGATYTWDNTINDWKGATRGDTVFADINGVRKNTSRTSYAWVNNTWVEDNKYTWTYDAAGREWEYTTYKRNTSTNQLMPKTKRIREWYNASKTTLDIQYTAHNGTDWSAGTKKQWSYDESGNTTEYFYYSSLSNGNWIGNTHEVTGYTAGKKTHYLKQTWSNGDFVNNAKEEWHYNGPLQAQTFNEKQTWSNNAWVGTDQDTVKYEKFGTKELQTVHEHRKWSNGEWALSAQDSLWYNASGGKILEVKYTFTNGVRKGTNYRTEYMLTDLKSTITYSWKNGAWAPYRKTIKNNVLGTDTIENCTYSWSSANGGQWEAYSKRTLSMKGGNDVITQSWSSNDWVNSTRVTVTFSGSQKTQEAAFAWSSVLNEWVGTARMDYHYYATGKPDTIKTYRPIGTEWVDSLRTVNTYNTSGINIMTHNAKWNGTRWVMQSMSRTDIIDHIIDGIRQTLNATWTCQSDSIWIGGTKDTTTYYAANGKPIYRAVYDDWRNNDWVPYFYVNYEYDEAWHTTVEERFEWNGTAWYGKNRDESRYDEKGNKTLEASYKSWDNTTQTWIGSTKTEKVFDSNKAVISSILSVWGETDWRQVFRTTYIRDTQGREIDQIVEHFEEGQWLNTDRYIHTYKGSTLIKDNAYKWLNNQWSFTSRNETYYDEDAQAKLRRKVYGLWSEGVNLSFADDHYFYACDAKGYTIRFVNYNGVELSSQQMAEGTTPAYTGETPTKPANDQYTYTFKGWTPALAEVTGDATYTADFDSVAKTYTIRFVDEDNTELQSSSVEYGQTPVYTGSTPEKESTAEFTYSFAGWMPEIVSVTADATYTATYTATKRSYTIIWLDSDDTQIEQQTLEYGTIPSHEAPVRENTAEYSYVFLGWTPEIATVTGDVTYTALFSVTKNSYTITWLNPDNSLIEQQTLEYGLTPSHEAPVKENTAQYTYSFTGWAPDIVAVSGDATYTAQFDSVANKYPISFLNYDGVELQKSSVEYGQTPAYTGATPVKPNTAQYTYSFKGWTPQIASVSGEATYIAEFDSVINSYTITWQDENGVELSHETLAYGATPSHDDPAKTNTAEFIYAFTGWTPQIAAVTGDATYRATFSATKNKYAVSFLNYDGTELQNSSVEFGQTPAYTGATPLKPATAQYTYTFTGWTPQIASVSGEATYIAQYDSVINSYTVIFYYEDGYTELDRMTLQYGETPSTVGVPSKLSDIQYTYHFAGWSPELAPVTGDVAYTPVYDTVLNQYPITFKNYNGRVLKTVMTDYGTIPEYTGETPDKPATAQYSFLFAGWKPELTEVTGAATYTAVYESELNSYTITFFDEDGTQLDQVVVEYGKMPTTDVTPTKPEDEEYTYTFAGWTPRLVKVTSDASYWATYTATKKTEGLYDINDQSSIINKVMLDGTIYIRRGTHIYTLDGVLVE